MKNRYVHDTKWYKKDPISYAKACEQINSYKGNSKSGWIGRLLAGLPPEPDTELQKAGLEMLQMADTSIQSINSTES